MDLDGRTRARINDGLSSGPERTDRRTASCLVGSVPSRNESSITRV